MFVQQQCEALSNAPSKTLSIAPSASPPRCATSTCWYVVCRAGEQFAFIKLLTLIHYLHVSRSTICANQHTLFSLYSHCIQVVHVEASQSTVACSSGTSWDFSRNAHAHVRIMCKRMAIEVLYIIAQRTILQRYSRPINELPCF